MTVTRRLEPFLAPLFPTSGEKMRVSIVAQLVAKEWLRPPAAKIAEQGCSGHRREGVEMKKKKKEDQESHGKEST